MVAQLPCVGSLCKSLILRQPKADNLVPINISY